MKVKFKSKKGTGQTPCPFGVGAVEGKHDSIKVGSVMCSRCMYHKGAHREYYKNGKSRGGEVECSAGEES